MAETPTQVGQPSIAFTVLQTVTGFALGVLVTLVAVTR